MKSNSKKPSSGQGAVRGVNRRRPLKNPVLRLFTKRDASLTPSQRHWRSQGFHAGRRDALSRRRAIHRIFWKKMMNNAWVKWSQSQPDLAELANYVEASTGYIYGYSRAIKRMRPNWILLPNYYSVDVIVTVSNGEQTIGNVLEQLKRLPLREIIVIVHGSTDRTLEKARSHSKALIVHVPEAIGQEVGRELGRKMSQADLMLCIQGDRIIGAEQFIPFIQQVEGGPDLACRLTDPSLMDQIMVLKTPVYANVEGE